MTQNKNVLSGFNSGICLIFFLMCVDLYSRKDDGIQQMKLESGELEIVVPHLK